uniref:YjeF N-terminal domain-containing protein n=1 Tax=Aplanochytrium stocchinoi TaxID=215587 RepID=A0A7S3PG82_9STRA
MSKLDETPISLSEVPVMEGDEMRLIDLEVTEDLNVYRTMETVGIRTADFVQYYIQPEEDQDIIIVSGKGNNGGNSITTGRILLGRGYRNIKLILSHSPEVMKGVASEQFDLFLKFGGSLIHKRDVLTSDFAPNTLLIDGLLGTGITRSPSGVVGELIEEVNKWGFRVLSCDIPSGLNHSTGEAYEPCIRAKWTLNYHVVKSGQGQPLNKRIYLYYLTMQLIDYCCKCYSQGSA